MFCKNIEAHLAMQKLVSIMKSVPFTQRNMVAVLKFVPIYV